MSKSLVVVKPYVFHVLHTTIAQLPLVFWIYNQKDTITKTTNGYLQIFLQRNNALYHSLDAALMADVILVNEGRHPPGNMYSLIKSELRLYSS